MNIIKFSVETKKRTELIDITESIKNIVKNRFIKGKSFKDSEADSNFEGLAVVYSPHTTTAILVNESYDPDVALDISEFLNKLVPDSKGFRHGEGNSDAHIKSSIIGNSRIIPILNGELLLGRWEGIFLCEFDGPRKRDIIIVIIK